MREPRKRSFLGRDRVANNTKKQYAYESKLSTRYAFCVTRTTKYTKIPVPMRLGETPVHIPNTMVKTQAADDTILETIWESRWVPDIKKSLPMI